MPFNDRSRLDTSQVEDRRGRRPTGNTLAVGGGGLGIEYMAASRALERGRFIGEHALVDSIPRMTASALNLDHHRTSQPGGKLSIRMSSAHDTVLRRARCA